MTLTSKYMHGSEPGSLYHKIDGLGRAAMLRSGGQDFKGSRSHGKALLRITRITVYLEILWRLIRTKDNG